MSVQGKLQGGSDMTGADLCVNKCKQSRSYLNHLVYTSIIEIGIINV